MVSTARVLAINLLGLYETQTINCTTDVVGGLSELLQEISGSEGLTSIRHDHLVPCI